MMRAVGTASLLSFAAGQQAGTNDEHYLMPLTLQECRWNSNGQQECDTQQKSMSLDSTDEADLKAATEIRDKENADLSAQEKNLVEPSTLSR
jgi:hypothetical protein